MEWCSLWSSLKEHVRQFTVNPHKERAFRPTKSQFTVRVIHYLRHCNQIVVKHTHLGAAIENLFDARESFHARVERAHRS